MVEEKISQIASIRKKKRHYTIINEHIGPEYTYKELNDLILNEYTQQRNSFKVNLGFGYILYNTVKDEYKYHYVSQNNMLFENAITIKNRDDVSNLLNHIISLDLPTNYYLKKPSSSWVLAGLTNIEMIIIQMKHVPIGHPPVLPDYIKNSHAMYSLVRHESKSYAYKDNKCFFRCLALQESRKNYQRIGRVC